MESISVVSKSLITRGLQYFSTSDLGLFVTEIEKRYSLSICNYKVLHQEKETVQLEFSFLTNKTIFDFTLKKNTIEIFTFFLRDITAIRDEITPKNKTITIYNGGSIGLSYKAYTDTDKKLLEEYVNNIINEINKM